MDYQQLLDKIDQRLDKTDQKIDELKEVLSKEQVRVAVLESQMSGAIKIGMIGLTSLLGIVGYLFHKGFN